jgi:hypothetical protein
MVGQEDAVVFLVIEGAPDLVDDAGKTVATENWQTFLKRCRDYCREKGLMPVNITKL